MFLSKVDIAYLRKELGLDSTDTSIIELCSKYTKLTLMTEGEDIRDQQIQFATLEIMAGRAFVLQGLAKSAFERTTLKTFNDLLGRKYCVLFDSAEYFDKFKVTPRPSTLFTSK